MNNADRTAELDRQIKLRLNILRQWMKNGIPGGVVLPRSLTRIRKWKDDELGLRPIGSSSSFTTTHDRYGKSVADIAKALDVLRSLNKKTRVTRKTRAPKELKKRNDDYHAALIAAANKYVMQNVALEEAERQVRVLQQNNEQLKLENRKLSQNGVQAKSGTTVSRRLGQSGNVTNVDFGKSARNSGKKRRQRRE